MKRQKSTHTMRSPEGSFRQSYEPLNWMPTLTEISGNWNSADNYLHNKAQFNAIMSLENQILNPEAISFSNIQASWNQFCFPQEHTKPEIIATQSDLFDEFSEVSLPVDFSDMGSIEDLEPQEPFPEVSYWQEPVDLCQSQNQSVAIPPFPTDYSVNIPTQFMPLNYYADARNPLVPNMNLRLFLTNFRSVCIVLRHLVSVEISPEGAIYVHNIPGQNIAVVNDTGDKMCIIHPNCRVLQEGSNVHVMTHQARLVKIGSRGITFTAAPNGIVYLVDESGTKSTSGKFIELGGDYSSEVFYGPFIKDFALRCADSVPMLSSSTHQLLRSGDDFWKVGNVQIKQDQFGNIEVSRDMGRVLVKVLPSAGDVKVETPFLSVNVGCFSKRYLTIQKDNCRVMSGFCGLTVQNGTQKAGLDRNGKVVIF